MPRPCSLIFARTYQDAENSALIDWGWQQVGELRFEFSRLSRDDNGRDYTERVRYVPDTNNSLSGLQWNTKVYLGRYWGSRADAPFVRKMIEDGFFVETDPKLPPPRQRTARQTQLTEIRKALQRLEK